MRMEGSGELQRARTFSGARKRAGVLGADADTAHPKSSSVSGSPDLFPLALKSPPTTHSGERATLCDPEGLSSLRHCGSSAIILKSYILKGRGAIQQQQ